MKTVNAEVTIKFIIENTGSPEEWEFDTYDEVIKWLIQEEGLWGLVNDEYEILKIEMV